MTRHDDISSDRDDALRRLLRELPRESAPDDFTARTLARLRAGECPAPMDLASAQAPDGLPDPSRSYLRPLLLVAAATLLLAVAIPLLRGALGGAAPGAAPPRAAAPDRPAAGTDRGEPGRLTAPVRAAAEDRAGRRAAELDALRREHAELARELAGMRERIPPADEVVWVGGDESVDLVLDLGRLARARANDGAAFDLVPASSTGGGRRP